MKMAVVEATDDHTFILLEGSLDIEGVREIETQFLANTAARRKPAILEFSKVDYIASFGLRMLVEAVKALDRDGLKVVILRPTPEVEKLLLTVGLNNILTITHDEMEARRLAE